jgi:hypothetical protein
MTAKARATRQRLAGTFLDAQVGRFRRSDLASFLYPTTAPRSLARADELAASAIAEWSKAGKIIKAGHVHWIAIAQSERLLKSGRKVKEEPIAVSLPIQSRCPSKWVAVDLETGTVYRGTKDGWKGAGNLEITEAKTILDSRGQTTL